MMWLAAALGALVLTGILVTQWRRWQSSPVFALFDISPDAYRLLGADIGGRAPYYLRDATLAGAPDAVFLAKSSRSGVIGELKSRSARGRVSRYERYQVTLYMGLLRDAYSLDEVSSVIQYADGSVRVMLDAALYQRLRFLEPEYRHAVRRWRAPNTQPLHARPPTAQS